jgi:hypothetical protein
MLERKAKATATTEADPDGDDRKKSRSRSFAALRMTRLLGDSIKVIDALGCKVKNRSMSI